MFFNIFNLSIQMKPNSKDLDIYPLQLFVQI